MIQICNRSSEMGHQPTITGRKKTFKSGILHTYGTRSFLKTGKGQHKINIRATDRFGQSFQATETFRVEEAS